MNTDAELPKRIHIPCPVCKECNHVVENLTLEEVENVAEFEEIGVFELDIERMEELCKTEIKCQQCGAIIKITLKKVAMVQIEAEKPKDEIEKQNAPTTGRLQ